MINYSFIIPHHNCPNLLQTCINSIPNRNDIEIIIVDDNSNPDQVDFSSFPGSDRTEVKTILLKENVGGGAARNIGVEHAIGKWLIFSDSDDSFCSDTLNQVLDNYKNNNADIVYFNVNCLKSETLKRMNDADEMYINNICATADAENKCRYLIKVPWGKLVKKQLVENHQIRFDETKVGNDAWFSLQLGFYADKVELFKEPVYNWMVRSGSVTTKKDKDSTLIHYRLAKKLNKFKEEHNLYGYRDNLFMYIPRLLSTGLSLKEIMSDIINNTPNRVVFKDFTNLLQRTLIRVFKH